MVAKKVAGVAGAGAGGFAGGFLNNPGALVAIGIVITIVTSLLIFRKDISNFFSGLGKIELPELPQLPSITFPSFDFDFPDITFPDISFPDITFPSIDIGIPSLPSLQTPEQQLELFGELLTEQEESIIERIQSAIGADEPDVITDIITQQEGGISSLFEFNPPGIVGFGVLGPELGGISETLAGQLGITPGTSFEEAISLLDLFQEGGFAAVLGAEDVPEPTIVVDPSIEGEFIGGGPSFEGGFIFVTEGA